MYLFVTMVVLTIRLFLLLGNLAHSQSMPPWHSRLMADCHRWSTDAKDFVWYVLFLSCTVASAPAMRCSLFLGQCTLHYWIWTLCPSRYNTFFDYTISMGLSLCCMMIPPIYSYSCTYTYIYSSNLLQAAGSLYYALLPDLILSSPVKHAAAGGGGGG